MKCPVCKKEGIWYRYQRTPDGTFLEQWNGSFWREIENIKEFERKYREAIEKFTYGTGEVSILVHRCGYAVEGTDFEEAEG